MPAGLRRENIPLALPAEGEAPMASHSIVFPTPAGQLAGCSACWVMSGDPTSHPGSPQPPLQPNQPPAAAVPKPPSPAPDCSINRSVTPVSKGPRRDPRPQGATACQHLPTRPPAPGQSTSPLLSRPALCVFWLAWPRQLTCQRPSRRQATGPTPRPRWRPLPALLYAQGVKTIVVV